MSERPANWILHEDWLAVVPAVHGRAAFAAAVRQAFSEFKPRAVAVELPPAFMPHIIAGVARLPALSVITVESAGSSRSIIPIDPADAIIEAVRLAIEHEVMLEGVDALTDLTAPSTIAPPDPDLAALTGVASYHDRVLPLVPQLIDELARERDQLRESTMAWRVGALREFERVLLVVGLSHWEPIRRLLLQRAQPPQDRPLEVETQLFHLGEKSVYGILGEIPFIAGEYERRRENSGKRAERWNPESVRQSLVERAEREYEHHFGEEVPRSSRLALRRFASRLARQGGRVFADLYDLVVAAKGCHDDDLAGEVYDLATRWFAPENPDGLPEIDLDPEMMRLSWHRVRMLRQDPAAAFRRRMKEGADEDWQDEWNETFQGGMSYVPEDMRQLQWVSYVRHTAPEQLTEARTIRREFKGSLLDGIDMRATMREWWRRQIIVKEEMRLRGAVGPVAVIYEDEPLKGGRYPHCMVWPGELHDEGDLVLYGTTPGQEIIGPGISRCEYGGFLTLPGVHLNFWEDPWVVVARLGWVETKAELLIITAALCSLETFIAVISPRRPRHAIEQRVERLGCKMIHIPSAGFTPASLRKIRTFHVLASRKARSYARDYIEPRPRGFRA